jgi:hypothetical protein
MNNTSRVTIPSVYGRISDTIDYAARIDEIRKKALTLSRSDSKIAAEVIENDRDVWARWMLK